MSQQVRYRKACFWTVIAVAAMAGQAMVSAASAAQAGQGRQRRYTFEQVTQRFDADKNGAVTKEEMGDRAELLDGMDTNKDGVLTAEDFAGQEAAAATEDLAAQSEAEENKGAINARERAVPAEERAKRIPADLQDKVKVLVEIPYGTMDPEFQNLDAYLVKSGKPAPVLIEAHPGAFCRGSKSSEFFFLDDGLWMKALRSGISVVSINYRLSPKYIFPAHAEDLARAIQFVRSKAEEWNIDPDRIASSGGSAGAHLSTWVAFHDDMAKPDSPDPIERYSTRLTCVVEWRGPMDFFRMMGEDGKLSPMLERALPQFLGIPPEEYGKTEESKEKFKVVSPITYATPDDPPVMLVYTKEGDFDLDAEAPEYINDPHVFWWGIYMNQALNKIGVPHEVLISKLSEGEKADAEMAFLKKYLLDGAEDQGN